MYWRFSEAKFRELDADNRIWWGADGNNVPAIKRFLSEVAAGRTPQTLWFYKEVGHTQDAKKTLLKYVKFQHTENVLNSVKPVELLQRILQLAGKPDENSIVLDFFSGSATTAHAVLKQNFEDGGNRRFIGVQIPEPLPTPEPDLGSIFEMGLTRVKNFSAELRDQSQTTTLDIGCWLVLAARSLGAIPFVRSQIVQARRGVHDTRSSDIAQVAAVGLAAGAVALSRAVLLGALGVAALAGLQLWWVRRAPPAVKVLGLRQMALGLALVVVTGLGVHLA